MKISLNWVKEFTKLDLPVDKLVGKIGAQVGAVEEVNDLAEKYKGIVVARVVSCVAHPNADKLSVCMIDDNKVVKGVKRDTDGHVQVVCGAPNVRRDQLVAWCPPGVVVPSTLGKDQLKLDVRDIRGQKSSGMLASPSELDLGSNHGGILEIDVKAKPGTFLADVYELNDFIIDIENKMFTHRPDCFGQLGVARELSAIQGHSFKSPAWYLTPTNKNQVSSNKEWTLEVKNEISGQVPRFMAVAIASVKIGPSPMTLQTYLSRLGVKPVNNIVDLTNYHMLLTGQPLHAYDADKLNLVAGDTTQRTNGKELTKIVVRNAKKDEDLLLLNGKTIKLGESDIVIASGQKAVGLGGIMGGATTEVDNHTKNIILECATFEKHAIHRSAMAHGLFTEASTRFSKQQSPLQNEAVFLKTLNEIILSSGGKMASEIVDNSAKLPPPNQINTNSKFINERLGLALSASEMSKILACAEFKVSTNSDKLSVYVPFWRTDIKIAEDIVEEIGRLYGYDRLPQILPRHSIAPAHADEMLTLKAKLRSSLSAAGANETLTYSFVPGKLLKTADQDANQAYQIANALSPDLQYYRLSLIPSLLELIHPNIKAGYEEFALFEINKAHHKSLKDKSGLPIEEERLALIVAANDKKAKSTHSGAPYYLAAKYLVSILAELGIRPNFIPFKNKDHKSLVLSAAMAPFNTERSAYVHSDNGELLGIIGEFSARTQTSLKLPAFSAGFELNTRQLMLAQNVGSSYVVNPKYPAVIQDICLKVKSSVNFAQLFDYLWDAILKYQPQNVFSQLAPVDIFQRDSKHKQITLRLTIASYERTLEASLVNNLLDKIANAAKTKLGAERV